MSATIKLNGSGLLNAVAKIRTNVIEQNPTLLAKALEGFVIEGSKRHKINKEDLTVEVFNSHKDQFTKNGAKLDDLMLLLLKGGTCFFDAWLYLGMEKATRPEVTYIDDPEDSSAMDGPGAKGDPSKITSYVFFVYFYIMVRGHAPSLGNAYDGQNVPAFLKSVLAIGDNPKVVARYLASFDLNKMDPAWVCEIPTVGMGREAQTRFGLGVAGYRICSVFNYYKPDADGHEEYAEAVEVAKSFLAGGLDWDFHPATRSPDVLTKYGNINKNCTNLLLKVYKEDTIKTMLAAKKLAVVPVYDEAHTNYVNWVDKYEVKRPIFKKS